MRKNGLILGAALVLVMSGCNSAPPSNDNVNTAGTTTTTVGNTNTTNTAETGATPATSATPTPQPTASPQTADNSANNLPVTLPVLDALFADENFASRLKSKLQLTDEQIDRLRKAARDNTAQLSEPSAGSGYSGTTSNAIAQADEEIKSVVGDEKAPQVETFVRQWWASGGESEESNTAPGATASSGTESGAGEPKKPNAVPSDTRVVVNIPAYRMDLFDQGRLVKSYKIGIGYPEFPLPTGLRKAKTIIFNPTWTPPDSPWVKTSNKVRPGEKIAAGSRLNPLGPLKIPIGLPSLIHGGKSPARIGTFASHGCVGLTSPEVQDFAQKLAPLGGIELSPADIETYARNKTETRSVNLNNPVPVELRYETIVVEDGKLHIYRDVYDKGTNTEENLRAVLATYGVSLDQLSPREHTQVMNALQLMARDATGKPTGTAEASATSEKNKNARGAKSSHVTHTIKGQKEIVIPIAALKGKGYPAPVDLDTGAGPKQTASARRTNGQGQR